MTPAFHRRRLSPWAAFAVAAVSALLCAAAPAVSYDGRLYDEMGQPRSGTFHITFSLWNSASGGEAPLWQRSEDLYVSRGRFSVTFGASAGVPETAFSGGTRYLQVQVAGESPSPRIALAAPAPVETGRQIANRPAVNGPFAFDAARTLTRFDDFSTGLADQTGPSVTAIQSNPAP